jgi:Cof subfamily protein (haloacid dehalogenase superfamily)
VIVANGFFELWCTFMLFFDIIKHGDKMKKAIFFDLDGTLLDPSSNSIPISTINALKRLKENGHFLAVATGRSLRSLLEIKLDELITWDGYICSSGQQVFLSDTTPLYEDFMDPNDIKQIEKIALRHDINIQYQCEHSFLLKEADGPVFEAHSFFHEPIPTLVKHYDNENIEMLMIYAFDHDKFKLFSHVDSINLYPGQSSYADVISKAYSKSKGVKELLTHHQLDPNDYIAFGDSTNDLDMLKDATLSIAMGNANIKLKETADIITRSVDQDGIYTACKVCGLI